MRNLVELRATFFEEAEQRGGTTCPVCDQHGEVYKRKLNNGMAAVLVLLYRVRASGFTHVQTLINATFEPKVAASVRGDFAKLRYWGFIKERAVSTEEDKRNSGFWVINENGCAFVERRTLAFKHVWVYNREALGFTEETIDINDALGDHFSYAELRGGG